MNSRVFGLDLLRAYAILCVVYEHGYIFISNQIQEKTYNIPAIDGVTIFFVLSGFLIGRILLKTIIKTDFSVKILLNFWARRWLRTIPSYLLILSLVIFYSKTRYGTLPPDLYKYYIFSQNLFSRHPSFYGEAWSLSVEEWFYLAAPLSVYFLLKCTAGKRNALIGYWIIFCIVISTTIRIYSIYRTGAMDFFSWDSDFRKVVIMRLDSLMTGVGAAYFSLFYCEKWGVYSKPGFITGLAIILINQLLNSNTFYHYYIGITASSLGVFFMLPYLSSMQRRKGAILRIVTYISTISYSMYLLNYTLVRDIATPYIIKKTSNIDAFSHSAKPFLSYAFYWAATIVGSHLLTRYYETPILSIRDKLWPPPTHGITGTPVRNL